jgi:nucleotide-binding universal stress UspA family protein
VLIAPYASGEYKVGRNVLIAWNGSKEATSAMTSAIPLVRGADNVIVAMLDPEPQDAPAGIAPAADIVAYLARHQVRAITLTVPGAAHAGEALLSLVAELDCDLLVMGCYGHTRFRELLLGGATRAVLRSMSVPVLMAQ